MRIIGDFRFLKHFRFAIFQNRCTHVAFVEVFLTMPIVKEGEFVAIIDAKVKNKWRWE